MAFPIQSDFIATRRSGQVPGRGHSLVIIRMAKGHAVWSVNGQPVPVREGDVVFVLPGQMFGGIESSESVPVRAERVVVQLPRAPESGQASALGRALGIEPEMARFVLGRLRAARLPRVAAGPEAALLCRELVARPHPVSPMEQCLQKACAFELLCRICLHLEAGRPPAAEGAHAASEQRVAAFLQKLESCSAEPWTLETMARETGLGRSRFGTLCRQLTGENPITFLSRLRVRASRRLLRETSLSITEVAMACGFGSSQYFSKIFRRYQGHEPSHFRQLSVETRQARGIHYLKSDQARHVALAARKLGAGDYLVECRITLDRLGGTAASLELGVDRFGFDGRQGCFFCEGGTFGEAEFFGPAHHHLREGVPFDVTAERKAGRVTFSINGVVVARAGDIPWRRVGAVGLRPLRNGISIHSFRINGRETALQSVDLAE